MEKYYASYGGFLTSMEHEMLSCRTSSETDKNASLMKEQM